MAAITASAVNELRQATGCGLMDCKKALVENEGDFEKAVVYLREKGLASQAKCVPYVHMKGKVAVLVELETEASAEAVTELGRDVAMQICALNPQYLDESNVPAADVEKEKEIRIATAKQDPKNAKKPDAIIEKIVVGGLGKWFKEICLLQMPFVKDDKVSVEQHVAAVAKELGTPITVKGYVRFEKGEGIEKRQDDLAAEVAKMVNG